MSMSRISACEVSDCSYNTDKKCHTMAITVGDMSCAMCDTFTKTGMKGGDPGTIGGVGACRADNCKFNKSLECTANNILVGMHSNHADCKTFTAR
ncbi:MAG: DUF1540 domain-containing protein [Nitrospiraceae bacterium]|nr:MAG: DUF1540 domain-containing protein [Nitrospiraceae bacterium]